MACDVSGFTLYGFTLYGFVMFGTIRYMTSYTLSEGRPLFGDLVRRASHNREHITITDRGHPAAVILGAAEYEAMTKALEDLEDDLALARYRAREAAGDTSGRVSAAEARRILGVPAGQA